MPCPLALGEGFFRSILNKFITTVAWLLADWFGWRVGVAVYPPMLRGKTAIVTGANAGIGAETTKALLQQGATVIMACRSLVGPMQCSGHDSSAAIPVPSWQDPLH
jgi:hypothetical protein